MLLELPSDMVVPLAYTELFPELEISIMGIMGHRGEARYWPNSPAIQSTQRGQLWSSFNQYTAKFEQDRVDADHSPTPFVQPKPIWTVYSPPPPAASISVALNWP